LSHCTRRLDQYTTTEAGVLAKENAIKNARVNEALLGVADDGAEALADLRQSSLPRHSLKVG
jgi:hypothetical protein